jgi:PIN domain nuclease of toxin-antitoxin system
MDEGLGFDGEPKRTLITYLDTHIVTWLAANKLSRFSPRMRRVLDSYELLISPMVYLELEFLYEIKRSHLVARDIQRKVEFELGVRLCTLPFDQVATAALDEKWTRDPFDRLIVANAKANGLATLITADEHIARHYPRVLW